MPAMTRHLTVGIGHSGLLPNGVSAAYDDMVQFIKNQKILNVANTHTKVMSKDIEMADISQ